jgi:hypothetical protein
MHMTVAKGQTSRKPSTSIPDRSAGYGHRQFRSYEEFRPYLQQEHPSWPDAVQLAMRRMAVAGILDPLSDRPIPPADLEVAHSNLRETVAHHGVISRQRAVLLVLRELVEQKALPAWKDMRVYMSEAVTPFAELLQQQIPRLRCSEYLPEPDHWLRGRVAHRDLRRIGLPPATFHAVICNEILEHVEELIPSLEGMAEVISLGGYLISTVPFLYGQQEHLVKAIWRGEGQEPEVLGEPDYHGNPVSAEGSLVFRYPGWQLLDDLREAGFRDAAVHAIQSSAYGVVGQELPIVFVVVARR